MNLTNKKVGDKLKRQARNLFFKILNLSDKVIETFIISFLREVKAEHIKYAIDNDIVVFDYLFYQKFKEYVSHPQFSGLIRLALRKYWRLVEKYLADVRNLYFVLTYNKPDIKKLLDSPKGRKWLNKNAELSYKKLYKWVWE